MKNNNKLKVITFLLGAALLFGGCGTTQGATIERASTSSAASSTVSSSEAVPLSNAASSSDAQSNTKNFTLDELSQYDGKNGNDAYVAVAGNVYDVTNADKWQNGNHYGVQAGTDCTTAINSSPHGSSVLDGLIIVGTLVE
ncbi:Predicted heme/steroid binding protein [Carnobacterium alterfunditum]|uniref:Predicted heme/steroid binding protein n=1 Tax=Carnobacterium alterfunditum TaxID=28230 RepID=A0A1N6G2S8_9LACT|nr:Predicted heme/steroid binding protein [Carnobacterium alterfunditum]